MNRRERHRDAVGLLVLLSVWILPSAAQAQLPLEEVKARYPVHIDVVRSEVLIGEPLVLRITSENRTSSPMRHPSVHRLDKRVRPFGMRDFVVSDPEGKTARWEHPSAWITDFEEIPPGGHYVEIQELRPVGMGAERRLGWPKAGKYTAKMLPEDMKYPDAVFTVVKPAGRDVEALELWSAYLGVTNADGDAREEVGRRLMEEYPDTVYGRWTIFEHTDVERLDKALREEQRATRDPSEPEGPETIRESEEVRNLAVATVTDRLRYLIEECPEFPLRDECMLRLARTLPDKQERRAQYQAILRDFPDTPAAYAAAEELEKE